MDKNSLIEEIELSEKLEKAGIMAVNKSDFIKSVIHEDRAVGFIGTGDNLKVFCIGEEKMEKSGMNYKELLDEHPELTWRRQKLGDDMEIGPEKNTELLEKYESLKTREKMTLEKDKSKNKRSYKRLQ